jgi:hypothetical protein
MLHLLLMLVGLRPQHAVHVVLLLLHVMLLLLLLVHVGVSLLLVGLVVVVLLVVMQLHMQPLGGGMWLLLIVVDIGLQQEVMHLPVGLLVAVLLWLVFLKLLVRVCC